MKIYMSMLDKPSQPEADRLLRAIFPQLESIHEQQTIEVNEI